jgi:hypothetical protein
VTGSSGPGDADDTSGRDAPELRTESPLPAEAPPRVRAFPLLAFLGLCGSLATVPYAVAIAAHLPPPGNAMADPGTMATAAVVQFILFLLPAILIGLRLAERLGLDVLRGGEVEEAGRRSPGLAAGLGLVAGVLTGGALLAGMAAIPEELWGPLATVEHPNALASILASVGAGLSEEILVRLGIMTIVAWLGWKLLGGDALRGGIAWPANAVAALAFGALHLPQAAAFGALTPAVVAFVLVGNGCAGMVFGWLYWRHGLIAAMLAHFATDLVLHVLGPNFG